MATATLYQYPKCSTCRKAQKWLDKAGLDVKSVDLVENPPSKATLARVKKLAEVPVQKLFNTSGQLYREGKYKDKLAEMTDAQALSELSKHGKLIKRPILLGKDFALVGFKEADWKAQLK